MKHSYLITGEAPQNAQAFCGLRKQKGGVEPKGVSFLVKSVSGAMARHKKTGLTGFFIKDCGFKDYACGENLLCIFDRSENWFEFPNIPLKLS